jgi:hypothetical protein
MSARTLLHARTLALLLVLFMTVRTKAQQFTVKLSGVVTELMSGDPLKDALVRVVKAGQDEAQTLTKKDGFYSFDLERGWKYVVWFSKDGMITKHVVIDTRKVPAYPDAPFYDMDLQITLFPWIADFDFSAFDQPLGEAGYKAKVHNMSWDTPYTDQQRPVFSKLMDEYMKTSKGYYKRKAGRQRDASER